ncbi:hypothetical protein BX616_000843 [Lobosporangium transversale]|nr:hypothetical protein BX616_000843 [Lobosporangium transversale]
MSDPSPPPSTAPPVQRTRASSYHSVPLSYQSTNPSSSFINSISLLDPSTNGSRSISASPQRCSMPLLPALSTSIRASSSALNMKPASLSGASLSAGRNSVDINSHGSRTTTSVKFNSSEIERSFQALLKKQPIAAPGPSLLHGKGHRQSSQHSESRLGSKHHDRLSSNNGSSNFGSSLSHSPVFGSPASEHAKNWIKTVGLDQPSESDSDQRESDADNCEDSEQLRWQTDHDDDTANQVELETETEVARLPISTRLSFSSKKGYPMFSETATYQSPVRAKDQSAIHPLSPIPPSPRSETSTPKPSQLMSPKMRPSVFDSGSIPPITSKTVNQPLPPPPEPTTALPDRPRARTKVTPHVQPPKKSFKNSPLPPKPVSVTERQPVSLSNPPRKCIHHGKILQVINTSTVKDRYLFLFSDILLITKHMSEGHPTIDSRFQVKEVIELKKISLSLTRDKYDSKNGEAGPHGNRKIPPILAEFIHTFDQDPNRAIKSFIQKRALHSDHISVAHLLFKTPELSKSQLALFLSDPANKHVYRAFLDQCQFAGVLLDEALRTLLSRLSLPDRVSVPRSGGSTDRSNRCVGYLLEEFTKRWYEANINVVVFDASIAHKLVIAMIVLNAQLHNNEGASLVKDRDEVGILVRPRADSHPSTPTVNSTPTMDSSLVSTSRITQKCQLMDLDDLTVFPKPTKDSFVENFQLLDQQRIVPRDTLHNIFLSISHQPLDIDSEKLDDHPGNSSSIPSSSRKLWPIMMSPVVLPPRLTLKVPSDSITITIPVLNPHFSIHLGGRDLKCEPSILEFGSHRSQQFRIIGSVPGKKTLTIQPKITAEKGTPEQYYDLHNLPSKHVIAIERQFMRHTFQISLLNDLGTRRRYLFGASTGVEKDEWARALTECLLLVKGQNAVRLNEHTGLEQSIGLQILREQLLGVEVPEDGDVVPVPSNVQSGPPQMPVAVVPPQTMGLGIPLDGHTLPVTSPRSGGSNTATVTINAGTSSPSLGAGMSTDWAGVHSNSISNSPNDTWMCKMPKPGSVIPDRYGWELVHLVEQNSLMALVLGFMGALGRDRLRRIEELRKKMEKEEEEEWEEEIVEVEDDEEEEEEEDQIQREEQEGQEIDERDMEEGERYVPSSSISHYENSNQRATTASMDEDLEDGVISEALGDMSSFKGEGIWTQ